MKYDDFESKKVANDERPEIEELVEMYRTIDLLTAYIMRHLNCSKEEAQRKAWETHECVDRILDGIDTMEVQGIEFEIRFTDDMNFIHCFHYKESGELVTWLWGWDEKLVIKKCKEFIKLKEGTIIKTQEFTSKNTSVNKTKLPAIYNKLNWEFIKETDKAYFINDFVVDYGCGKYTDHIKSFVKNKKFYFMGYDVYNQPMDKNQETLEMLESGASIGVIICSNLLCVIKEDEIVQQIVNQITATRQPYFFTVYEGNKSGVGKQTGKDQWQRNQTLKSIYEQFFTNVPDAIVYKGTICNKDYKKYLNK